MSSAADGRLFDVWLLVHQWLEKYLITWKIDEFNQKVPFSKLFNTEYQLTASITKMTLLASVFKLWDIMGVILWLWSLTDKSELSADAK